MLKPSQIALLIDLFEPHLKTEQKREAVLGQAFSGAGNYPDIDLSGAPRDFSRRLIRTMQTYRLDTGQPALWELCQVIYHDSGLDQQQQIDALRDSIFAAAIPTADYVVVAEGSQSIFISYSRQDVKLVERLRADLQAADFNLWIDRKGLKVGQKNWEREIRKALAEADAVVYVGSPHASDSNYVGAEIAIAEEKRKPIYCVWAAGEAWTESAPFSLVKAQYADLRGDAYTVGLAELIVSLRGEDAEAPAVEPVTVATPPPPPPDFKPDNPYKGLRAFESADRVRFFGREAFVETLLARLRAEPRFLAVIGASGSGKSSVMMAGLLPRVSDGNAVPGSRDWLVLEPFKPGKQPLEYLTDQFGRYLPHLPPIDIRRELDDESARGLLRLARRITTSRMVLYIDQFEELFTLTASEGERRQLIDLITTAVNEPDSPLTILLTMRADFYDRPLSYGELGELIRQHAEPILPMTITELFDAVRKPAALDSARLTFDPGLAEELVFAVSDEAGALPLLQFTLDLLFARRDGLRLTWEAYQAVGGVKGALANYAEAVYEELSTGDQPLARALFLRLIEPGATEQDTTRRRAPLSELAYADTGQTQAMERVLSTFVEARLLTKDRAGDSETVEVSHEALIREWRRLGGWLHAAREDVLLMKRIAADADDWLRSGRDEALLYGERRLQDAERWAERAQPSQTEAAFIAASAAKAERLLQQARDQQAERLRMAEDKAAAEERARLAEQERAEAQQARAEAQQARATRFRNAARFAGVLLAIAVGLLAFAGVTSINTNATLATVEFQATVGSLRADYDLAFLNFHGVLPTQAVMLTPVAGTAAPPTVIAQATRWASSMNAAWTPTVEPVLVGEAGLEVPMVYAPPGCFLMGSGRGETDEAPVNEVCFEVGFWIDQYEVWQAQFEAADGRQAALPRFTGDQRPVENITWVEARDFCDLRGARLPTEAEWEYAARGPDSHIYPWGSDWDVDKVVWNRSSDKGTADVGSIPEGASWVGALDMSGNVWEWVGTIYKGYPYQVDDGRDETQDTNSSRVLRGGSWYFGNPGVLRASNRDWGYPVGRDSGVGFRCARSS